MVAQFLLHWKMIYFMKCSNKEHICINSQLKKAYSYIFFLQTTLHMCQVLNKWKNRRAHFLKVYSQTSIKLLDVYTVRGTTQHAFPPAI